ncbi:hypothetical protein ETB97_005578 [Aspergillus alliaceus]|uniref:Methyltransferase domain-containing protein n=1 Tax=Petromyces alliaceus TaxID=209559 RepID=A0A8H6A8Z0_PETAA|nr:hypothetical protein ETB97_005578 [Aspergillus burnettii]
MQQKPLQRFVPISVRFFPAKKDPYDALATDGILEKLSKFISEYDGSKFFYVIGHFRPSLRVVKLGAGSDAATSKISQSLRHDKGQNLFSRYVLTDAAKSQLKSVADVEFASANIKRDLADQGFGDEEFDLIIGARVLHRTTDVVRSLSNIQKLLSPEGRLLVQEPSLGLLRAKLILENLPSWWSGQDGGRLDEHSWPMA